MLLSWPDFMTLEDYKIDIERYIQKKGIYAHNLVSITLRQVANAYGVEAANNLIETYELKKRFGIGKMTDPSPKRK